jgi:hypothetical protein
MIKGATTFMHRIQENELNGWHEDFRTKRPAITVGSKEESASAQMASTQWFQLIMEEF